MTFENRSLYATTYRWDFGDGAARAEAAPDHTYTQAGVYTVTLSAGDGVVTDTLTQTNSLTVTSAPPAADFFAFPLSGSPPLLVQFLNNSTGATSYE